MPIDASTDHAVDDHDPHDERPMDRRRWIAAGGAAAAAAAVAGLGASHTARAENDDTVYVGQNHTGTATTGLSGGSTLRVSNGSSSGGASVYGLQDGTGGAYAVRGDNSVTQGIGVYGRTNNSNGIGVYGYHDSTTTPGTGVVGISELGAGVIARGSNTDIAADGTGRVRLSKAGQTGSATQTGVIGTIARDATGRLWYCFATNQWQQIAGPGTGGGSATGTFTPITPARVFDSRIGAIPQSGLFGPNSNRQISVANGRDVTTGAVNATDVVPVGATAIAYNVTVALNTGANFLTVAPGNATGITASTINWSGASLANGAIVGLDADRRVRVFTGPNAGTSTHCIIDVTGYFV